MANEYENDSGLQVAMRMLLSIIAGLLLADILKLAVSSLLQESKPLNVWLTSIAVTVAALLFITRVVADNVLYYNAPDVKLVTEAYSARVLLIVCDLVSYTLCYHVVSLLTGALEKDALTDMVLIRVILDIAFVEVLHAAWCHLALVRLEIPEPSPQRQQRREWWRRWRWTSGVCGLVAFSWAATALTLDRFTSCYVPPPAHTTFLFTFALAAAIVYANVMREEYSGDWKAPVGQTRA